MVPAAAEELDRDLEDLGQLARHARLAHRSAEPAAGVAASPWPGAGYASFGGGDWSGYVTERARSSTSCASSASAASRSSPAIAIRSGPAAPRRRCRRAPFEPVGVEFITGSISAPGLPEGLEHNMPKDHPLRSLFVHQPAPDAPYQRTVNMLLLHGVRSCLEFVKTGDYERALKLSNREMSPHLQFLDLGGHGYAAVSAMKTRSKWSSCASRARSSAARHPTAARSRIESCIERSCGKAARRRSWSECCSKASCRCRSEVGRALA